LRFTAKGAMAQKLRKEKFGQILANLCACAFAFEKLLEI